MKHLIKSRGKRLIAAILFAVMCISALPLSSVAFTAEEGKTVDAYYGGAYVSADGGYYYSIANFDYIYYDKNGNEIFKTYKGGVFPRTKMMIKDNDGFSTQVMCIEAGVNFNVGGSYKSESGENSSYFQNLPASVQYGIMLTSVYGWQPGKTAPVDGTNESDFAMATQILLWEYQQQLRTSPTNLQDNSYGIPANDYYRMIEGRPAAKCYDWILEQMQAHNTIPSFTSRKSGTAQEYILKYDKSKDNYSLTLTDTNNTLSNLKFTGTSGITVTRQGNKYTFTSKKMITDAVTLEMKKDVPNMTGIFIWGYPEKQTMMSGAEDPVVFSLKLKTETTGKGHIVKTSEDGKISGIKFTINGNGVSKTVTTSSNGTADFELMPGIYTVTEESIGKYEPQNAQKITIISGGSSTVTFNNTLKRGSLKVTKISEDNLNEGVKFHLYGTSLSGLKVDEYAVTNSSGVAVFENVLIGTEYVLEEVDTAIRYVVPDKQTAAIEWNKVTNKTFNNILKKWRLTVTKSDKETGIPQGNASLAGAKYGVYKGDQLIDAYTTDKNGQFTTKYYVCDSDWSLREMTASTGYLVNPESLHIGAESKLYTVEYSNTTLDSDETVQKGKIAVIKHCDDGSTQIETPEVGAEFEVYLKKSGSYIEAKESERDILVCDENGFARSKDLPYGVYTVKQIKGWDGKELMKPFDVFINNDGDVYCYLINNATFESLIEIVKKDAETGKIIPASGIGFKVRNTDTGKYIVQHINYPTPVDIDTYYTDSTGKLMLPEALPYGNYEIIEQNTCYGYVLDSEAVPFTVDGSQTIVTIEKRNMPQKGAITVIKSGEVFSSVTAIGGGYADENGNVIAFPNLYQPVYSVQGLAGAVYEITAAEDIYTLDGTLRYAKGKVVAEITTGEDGIATSEPLYLGKFEVMEIRSPYGTVISDEVRSVELTYAGQEIEITETATAFYNERQKASVDLAKVLAQDERFGIGMNDEIFFVQFGLFAAADLTAVDGSVIPADGLIEIVTCDENGKATFVTDLPVDAKLYVKEITTNEQYILSDEKYPVNFEYAEQDVATVYLSVNGGEPIENDIIYGAIKGLKIDRETEETIAGAMFALFKPDETEFTAAKAILTAQSGEDGVFTFENIPYGNWLIKELRPAENFLPNEEIYPVTVSEHEQLIEITVVNDRITEIGTTATVDGKKEICATEIFTLTDNVSYKHIIPGKEYTLKGVLMDKTTGKPLLIDGKEITSETTFTPDASSGKMTMKFVFDSKYIKEDTDIVVFERLYKDGKEVAVHLDIDDENQTVKIKTPKIGTTATVDGNKEVTAKGNITINDVVSYTNLTPDNEYTVIGILIDKNTGKPFLSEGKELYTEFTFMPEKPDGEIIVSFAFDSSEITKETDIVVFETLYRNGVEIASHAELDDENQTVKIVLEIPYTGDNSKLGLWIGLCAVAVGGLISLGIMYVKRKKDDDE